MVPLAVIAAQLGHADTRMVEKHYGHLASNYIADTVRQWGASLGKEEPAEIVSVASRTPARHAVVDVATRPSISHSTVEALRLFDGLKDPKSRGSPISEDSTASRRNDEDRILVAG